MEFNDGSKYRILTNPDAQLQAGRTIYAYKACGKSGDKLSVDSSFNHHRGLRSRFKATLIYQFVYIQFSPELSAEYFYNTLGGVLYPGEMICIDPEAGGGFTAANVYDFCKRWLAIIEPALKTKAWIYTAKDFSSVLAPLTKDRVLWIPRYDPEPPSWSSWDVWQKAKDGYFPGCAEDVGDLNTTTLSAEELLARCSSIKETPPVTTYTYSPTKEQVEQFLNVCRGELGKGQYEFPVGSNRTKYGKWFGMDGQPWCAMGISWACFIIGILWRFASTQEARRVAQRDGHWHTTPKPGMTAMHHSGPSTGHVGVVEFVHTDGTITTLEWNTSPDSSGSQRDGDGMYRKRRSRSYWLGYIEHAFPVIQSASISEEEDMGPATVRQSSGINLVYVVGDDRAAYEIGRQGVTGFRKVGGIWTSGLSAVIRDSGEVSLFGRGEDKVTYWRMVFNPGGTLISSDGLGGRWTSSPSAILRQDGGIDIFGRGEDRVLYRVSLSPTGSQEGQPVKIGGKIWPKI